MSNVRERLLAQRGKRTYESVTLTLPGDPPIEVWLCSLSGAERGEFEESLLVEKTKLVKGKSKKSKEVSTKLAKEKLIARCVCKGNNDPHPIFTQEDVREIAQIDGAVVDTLYTIAARLTKFTDEDIEELAGN